MKCPHCKDQALVMSEHQGVEIDYCPSCRGLWLDRGELDKLLERAASAYPVVQQVATRERDANDDDHHRHHGHKHRYQKSWLSEIFD